MTHTLPQLLTFDIFGTVLDWRTGLSEACRAAGRPLGSAEFDEVIDDQAAEEALAFQSYTEIVAQSLVRVLGLDRAAARGIGERAGQWPLYLDSREALARLQRLVPCVAMTNSDRVHGEQVRSQLGFALADWVCAEEVLVYKPAGAFWEGVSARLRVPFGPEWWHVSAYADYDLEMASRLELTTVYVERPHRRPGPSSHTVGDLGELADLVESLAASASPS